HRVAQQAIALRRRTSPESSNLGISLEQDARHLLALGRRVEARAAADEALAIYKRTVGEAHPYVGSALEVLGRLLVADGKARDGAAALERWIALLERGVGPSSPLLCPPLDGLADALLDAGDPRGALAAAERAVALAAKAPPGELEAAQFRLAKARAALRQPGAVALARDARARLAQPPFPSQDPPALAPWLASPRPRAPHRPA